MEKMKIPFLKLLLKNNNSLLIFLFKVSPEETKFDISTKDKSSWVFENRFTQSNVSSSASEIQKNVFLVFFVSLLIVRNSTFTYFLQDKSNDEKKLKYINTLHMPSFGLIIEQVSAIFKINTSHRYKTTLKLY